MTTYPHSTYDDRDAKLDIKSYFKHNPYLKPTSTVNLLYATSLEGTGLLQLDVISTTGIQPGDYIATKQIRQSLGGIAPRFLNRGMYVNAVTPNSLRLQVGDDVVFETTQTKNLNAGVYWKLEPEAVSSWVWNGSNLENNCLEFYYEEVSDTQVNLYLRLTQKSNNFYNGFLPLVNVY